MQKLRIVRTGFIASLIMLLGLGTSFAQPVEHEELQATYKARIVEVLEEEKKEVPHTGTLATYQTVVLSIEDGPLAGKTFTVSDSSFVVEQGDSVYVAYLKTRDGTEHISIQEPYRIPALLTLFGLFVVAVLVFGRKQGFLALIGLFLSFGFIFSIFFPQLLVSEHVVLISTGAALLSLFVVMFVTHGFSRLTVSAFIGCSLSVLVTVILARYAVDIASLTGFSDEESVYLNLATGGRLDFLALLIGGIIIGVIGVIDDVAITQASVVHELHHANTSYSRLELYTKALHVGRDHMGAVINTLILAYTGASLPLVLLLYTSTAPLIELINREAVATEIIRMVVGSIGLLLAVPLTTLIAVTLMYGRPYNKHTHSHRHG